MLDILLFIPQGNCYFWESNLLGLHLISDALISIAYYSIPLTLFYFVQKRKDIPVGSIFLLFAAFIVFGGTTHLMLIWTLWYPNYWSFGIIKALTAGISVYTAIWLIAIIPQVLDLPSPVKLETINYQLQQEFTEYKQAEINLRESEQRYATLLAVAPVGIFRTDAVGNYNYVNDYYCQIAGLTPEVATGEGWQQKLHPDDRDKVVAEWYQSVQESSPFQLEYRFQHPDDTITWIYGQAVTEWDTEGQMTGYVGTITDISASKQAEAEQLQTEKFRLELKLLEKLFDTVLAGYWDWDLPNYQEYLSPGFKRMLGYEDDELPNSPDTWQHLIFPEDLPLVLDCLNCHILSRGEIPFYNEVRYRHKNGSTIWVICSGQVIEWNAAGEPLRMIGFHIDVSDRKGAEAKLQEIASELETKEQLFRTTFEQAAVGIAHVSLQGKFIRLNQRFCDIAGYPPEELKNLTFQEITHPDDLQSDLTQFDSLLAGESQTYSIEKRYLRKEGTFVWINLTVSLVEHANGTPDYFISVIEDISDRKRIEEQSLHYATQLEASNRELEAFAYSVSHDLRAPLRAIDGFSKALLEDYGETFDEDAKNYFDRIRKNVSRMGRLIEDLLSLSRVSRYEIRLTKVNLSTLAQELMEELQTSEPERQVELAIAPEVIVSADATLMRVVLTNFLQNAWKFTSHQAKSRIEFGKLYQEEQPVYFVRDDGAGFDMAHAKLLFGVFQRLHNTNEFPGTGIGLATVQRAIYRHGGKVWAEAAVEQGATFYFTL
ncbi:MAG: PAS domain S-box protein, partial [Symploca sp. SIO2G7]|nr:PAS domain S-box protein [Symploca sp. SIO2G7]